MHCCTRALMCNSTLLARCLSRDAHTQQRQHTQHTHLMGCCLHHARQCTPPPAGPPCRLSAGGQLHLARQGWCQAHHQHHPPVPAAARRPAHPACCGPAWHSAPAQEGAGGQTPASSRTHTQSRCVHVHRGPQSPPATACDEAAPDSWHFTQQPGRSPAAVSLSAPRPAVP